MATWCFYRLEKTDEAHGVKRICVSREWYSDYGIIKKVLGSQTYFWDKK